MTNPRSALRALAALGQGVWLDFIHRRMLDDGELARLVEDDAVSGVTSNPAIFAQAIGGSADYDADIRALAAAGADSGRIYAALTQADVGRAADLLRPVWERTGGADGFVSIEVSPHLAHDVDGTLAEARTLWAALARPNVMIKVPGTAEGLAAISRLIAEAINVNVTLLFSPRRYREVALAHMAGLEARVAAGLPVAGVASVASFFVSRIDTGIDAMLDARGGAEASALRGQAAIASARQARRVWRGLADQPRWLALRARGALPQRLLWASTGTKDPAYDALKYVEPLVGPDTVNTMPPQTLAEYRLRGRPSRTLDDDAGDRAADDVMARLHALGIDVEAAAQSLEEAGIRKFVEPFEQLMQAIEARRAQYAAGRT
jgi:transaldolase